MVVLGVLSISELRSRLSGVVDELATTGPVFAGSHRKPEVVLLSVAQYEELTAAAPTTRSDGVESKGERS